MVQKKLISVLIPTYNYANYITHALDSVLMQRYPVFEIIVVDDASTDNTLQVLAKYQKRIKLFINQTNIGPPKSFNKCLQYAHGEYVAFFHPDDLWEANFLEKTANILNKHPDVGVVFGQARCIDAFGNKLNPVRSLSPNKSGYLPKSALINYLIMGNFIPFMATVIRKDILMTNKGLDERLLQLCDWHLWIRLANQTSFYYIPKILGSYRVHAQSHSKNMLKHLPKLIQEKLIILSELVRLGRFSPWYYFLFIDVFVLRILQRVRKVKNDASIFLWISFAITSVICRICQFIYWR